MRHYFSGLVKLKISGRYPERFLNLCMQKRISVLKIERRNNNFFIWIKVKDFFLLPSIVRSARVRVKIVERYGLPFLWQRWRRRKVLLGGLSVFFIVLYYLSLRIWVIEIITPNELLKMSVEESLEQSGISCGMAQSSLDRNKLIKKIVADNPDIAWAGIDNIGTKLTISIVEKQLPELSGEVKSELTAVKNGEIIKAVPLEGVSLVEPGDMVQAGDVLVIGTDGRADGIVMARVTYDETASVQLVNYQYSRTGRKAYGASVFFLNKIIMQYDNSDKYLYAEREEYRKKLLDWRNQEPFVELIIDIYNELSVDYNNLSLADAKEQALMQAKAALGNRLPQDAYICEQSVIYEDLSDDIYSVTLRTVTEENIATGTD